MSAVRRRRISVVNDNPEFLELMSAILDDDAGYDVTLFNGDTTSVDEIAAAAPELVIVDLLLGGASGWEIVTLTRADERLSHVPIIVCSADVNTLRNRADELQEKGNVHLLPKPFGIDEMTALVQDLIGEAEVAVAGPSSRPVDERRQAVR